MAHRLVHRGGVEPEALSPRDANARRMPKAPEIKTKTAAQLKADKGKDHPPPPPPKVYEPPCSDRPNGTIYETGKPLGRGGFAICYAGTNKATGKEYALKIVKSRMPSKMEQKFQTELQIHSKMRHKNIVEFHRAFSFIEATYLVLEICPNASLMEMVKKRKGITASEIRFYSVQIAGAIKYMHSKGIIHRDLKMGNIFLDAQMNAKIGDFGLAALVVTGKDMQTIRRTTLCGTPNYIAPEILEKGKGGHDHMVDIWSLGIIMFAMFTSKPPFQSSTTDEIYRRARDRDYEWPEEKYIDDHAKDLVSSMLAEASQRPDPDAIVDHPFFTSGYVPTARDMTMKMRELPPLQDEFYMRRMNDPTLAQTVRNLKDLSRECGVGRWSTTSLIQTSIWKEMAAEEKHGLTPVIPLAEDIVYRPYEETVLEKSRMRAKHAMSMSSYPASNGDDALPPSTTVPSGLLRQPPQSFAAQQRAQNRPSTLSAQPKSRAPVDSVFAGSQSTRARPKREAPSSAPTVESLESGMKNLRMSTRSALPTSKSANNVQVAERAAVITTSQSMQSLGLKRSNSESIRSTTLFSPMERIEKIKATDPDLVLERLRGLQNELTRACNSRTMAMVSSKSTTPPHPHVVVKWVDYTNKFGLGYILNDGSIGCILRDIPTTEGSKTVMLPPAGVFIRNAERHIMRRQDSTYDDRNQPIPMTESIKFFENNGETGLSETVLSPENFRVAVNEDGSAGKMNPGKDIYQHRKRERIILWKKFANYMIAYGRDDAAPVEETEVAGAMSPGQKGTLAELVTFYQRFGDVGCWVFCDGHLQFNFPDHTKIVLNADGTWCHFWHLPETAAESLKATGSIGAAALDDRAMLSYPLQTLLNFGKPSASTSRTRKRPEIDQGLQNIPYANDFRRKIEFIREVVKEWVDNGGLGNSSMQREKRLRWLGYRETANVTEPQKQVWVTIGARGGDQRISTYVDPRKPWELGDEA